MYQGMGHEAMARQWELARVWCAALLVSCPRLTRCYSQSATPHVAYAPLLLSHSYDNRMGICHRHTVAHCWWNTGAATHRGRFLHHKTEKCFLDFLTKGWGNLIQNFLLRKTWRIAKVPWPSLGMPRNTKTDEFSEKFQMAFD